MRDRERELQHLVEFLRAINRGHDLSELTQTVLKYALSLVPQAQTGTFLVLNDEEGVFEYQAAIGWDLERLSRIKIPKECILQRQFAALGPAIVRDPQLLNRKFLPSEIASELETFPIAAFMTFPIRVEDEVIAYFNVDSQDDPDAFTQADLDCLEAVWEEITLVVRAARARRGL
ncbi:MAG: GAF domain-containing protein, partial [Candidatus Bipolaricaulota bacterium]